MNDKIAWIDGNVWKFVKIMDASREPRLILGILNHIFPVAVTKSISIYFLEWKMDPGVSTSNT